MFHRSHVIVWGCLALFAQSLRAGDGPASETLTPRIGSADLVIRVSPAEESASRTSLPCQNIAYQNGLATGAFAFFYVFGDLTAHIVDDCTLPPASSNRVLCAAQVRTFGAHQFGGAATYNLTVRIWSDCPDSPNKTLIAQGTFVGLANDNVERISTLTIDPPYLDDDDTVWVEVASDNPDAAWIFAGNATDDGDVGSSSPCVSVIDGNGTCSDDSACGQHSPYSFPITLLGSSGPSGSCCDLATGTCTDGVPQLNCAQGTIQSWSSLPCSARTDCVACVAPTCAPGQSLENEPDCFANYNDTTNRGCQNLGSGSDAPSFTPIACGQSGCGRTGTYSYLNGSTLEYRRDDDHYLLTITQDTQVTWKVNGEFPSEALVSFTVMQTNGTSPLHCPTQTYTGPGDTPDATAGPCQDAIATACLSGGGLGYPIRYMLRARPSVSKLGSTDVCGVPYTFSLTCQPCTLPTGACCTATGCLQVSRLACLIATGSDTLFYHGDGSTCPQSACTGAPSNDLCSNAIVLTCTGCVIPYDTTFAGSEGQSLGTGGTVSKDIWFDWQTPTSANSGGCTTGRIVASTLYNCYNTKLQFIRFTNCSLSASQKCITSNWSNEGTIFPLTLETGPPVVNVGPWVYGKSATNRGNSICYKIRVGGLQSTDYGPGILRLDYVCQAPSSLGWDVTAGRCCFWNAGTHTGNCMITPSVTAGGGPTCCATLGGYLRNTTDFREGSTVGAGSSEVSAVGCSTLPCPAEGEACFNAWDLGSSLGTVTKLSRNRIYFKFTVPAGAAIGSGLVIDACGSEGDPSQPGVVFFDTAMAIYRGFNLSTGECHNDGSSPVAQGPGTQTCTGTTYNNAEIARVNDCGPQDINSAGAFNRASCFAPGEVDPCLCLNVVASSPTAGQVTPGQTIWIGMGIKNTLSGSSRPFTDPVRSDSCTTFDRQYSIRVSNPASCFQCTVSCPPNATAENEPLPTDCVNYVDTVNAGCTASAAANQHFIPIICGQTYCGTSATYKTGYPCSLGCNAPNTCVNGNCLPPTDNARDIDVYRIQITSPQHLTWSVTSAFEATIQIIASPNNSCDNQTVVAQTIADSVCPVITAQADVCPGWYYLLIEPTALGTTPCGSLYYATLNCSAPAIVQCCPGDMNNDGKLNGADIRAWLDQLAAPVGQSDAALFPAAGCFSPKTCSADFTGDYAVDLSDLPGFVSALLIGTSCPATSCGSAPACHPVSTSDSAVVSDVGSAFGGPVRCADDFRVTDGQSLSKLCWWGSYFNFNSMTACTPAAGDSADVFQVTLYTDLSGVPGNVVAGPVAPINLVKTDTGDNLSYLSQSVRRFKYDADLPSPIPVTTGACYWLEIVNHTTGNCLWLWETSALGGNGVCTQKVNGSVGATNWQTFDLAANDFAFCLPGLRIDSSDCGLPPGRCCVYQSGDAFGTCSIQTSRVCEQVLGGHWQINSDCSTACPVIQTSGGCPGSSLQSNGPDLIVGEMTGPMNFTANGTLEAITFGAAACNVGNQEATWDACPANTHPVFGGNVCKWYTAGGATRFEQIGQSWLKNGFGADQDPLCCANCQPSGNFSRLGIGCSDPYLASQAANQPDLSPRYLVNAHTGVYPTGCTIHPSGGNAGRLEMEIAELTATNGGPGASVRFFGEFHYITFDDAVAHNQNNNASSRELAVTGSGSAWDFSFPSFSTTQVEIPAIRLWKTIDPGVVETDVDTPEDDGFPGLVILAAKATNLGTGFWRYEYAVNNLNSDRSIGSFSVPCPAGATVQNIGFHDVAYHGGDGGGNVNFDGTDWPGSFSGGAVSWATTPFATNQNANAIRWGTLYNFRFDANVPPAGSGGSVTLGMFKVVGNVPATTVVPAP